MKKLIAKINIILFYIVASIFYVFGYIANKLHELDLKLKGKWYE